MDYQDSNLDKQNQNLLCYHYTIVQTLGLSVKKRGKDRGFQNNLQIFERFFLTKVLFLAFQYVSFLLMLNFCLFTIRFIRMMDMPA